MCVGGGGGGGGLFWWHIQDAAKLEREKLNGDNHVIEIAATEQNQAASIMIPPYEREIYVITMIKKKIIEKCEAA